MEAFKRGAMRFEDYNYELYNKYILVDPTRDDNDDVDLGDFMPMPVQKNKKGVPIKNLNDDK
jgi:hypothetical protein